MRAFSALFLFALVGCSTEVSPGFSFELLTQDDCDRSGVKNYAEAERQGQKIIVKAAWVQGCGPGQFTPTYSIDGDTLTIDKGFSERKDGPLLACACTFEAKWSVSNVPKNVIAVRFKNGEQSIPIP
jgi:hypothetical protein